MRRVLLLAAATGMLTQPLAAQDGPVSVAVGSITPEDIYRRISVLADDSMAGRETPSAELDMAAVWIADEFRKMGLKPGAADGSFLQRYPIRRLRLDIAASSVAVDQGPTWRFGTDVARFFGSTGAEGVTGPTVVVSGSPREGVDLAGVSVEGAVVVFVAANFRVANQLLSGLMDRGPAAVIVVTDSNTRSDAGWRGRLSRQDRISVVVSTDAGTAPPVIEVRDDTVRRILQDGGFDLDGARRNSSTPLSAHRLPDLTLKVTAVTQIVDETTAPNVVAVLEGSDPVLKDEYLVFSGHMDHVGIGAAVNGDSIFNGADDDASGTVAVMEAAEAFAMMNPRPRRSLIFLLVSGEEKGLWGSEYFAENSPVPISKVVANLNADMVGRNWKDTIVVIGQEHSDLGETLHRVTDDHPELNMTPIQDPWPQERFYYRSDHFNFARKGVPILFFFNGTHEDYHGLNDEVDKVDVEKESRIVKLIYYLGLEIANRTERPQWDPESYQRIAGGVS
jgi:hypothetical protein